MAAKHRFELTEHLLRMIGVCYECRKARASSARTSSHFEGRQPAENSDDSTTRRKFIQISKSPLRFFTVAFALILPLSLLGCPSNTNKPANTGSTNLHRAKVGVPILMAIQRFGTCA